MTKKITVALAGNPNAGKTSVFNNLTGARAHVGNYPGVTVEKKEGRLGHGGHEIHLVDLPGTYSLTAYSMEELVARNFILDDKPDVVVDVVDAANLERNLYLAVQFMEIGVPVIIALNMVDVAETRGLKIDIEKLGSLLGVPIVPTVAREHKGLDKLLDEVVRVAETTHDWLPKKIRYGSDLDVRIKEISKLLDEHGIGDDRISSRWLSIKALEGDSHVLSLISAAPEVHEKTVAVVEEVTRHLQATVDDSPEGVIADHRYGYITSITKQAVSQVRDIRRTISDKVDMVVLNRLMGPLILLAVLYALYQFTFGISEVPVAWFEHFFSRLGDIARAGLPEGPLRSMIASGIIDGVGGVIGFVPLIAFMFFAIAILEDSGYMARIAFIMDRVLRTFGLHGNSVLALMVGGGISGGCAVPGVMAARTLRDPQERLATILVTPFMNCGAKLPVFAVLIAAFFNQHRAGMLFALTLMAWAMALLSARVLRWTILRGTHTPFVMELPPYRVPTLKGLLIHTWERVWQYIKKAGTIILAISILIWAMMTYPGLAPEQENVFHFQRENLDRIFLAGPGGKLLDGPEALAEFDRFQAARAAAGAEADRSTSVPAFFHRLAEAVDLLRAGNTLPSSLAPHKEAARSFLVREDQKATLAAARNHATLRHTIAGRIGTALETITRHLGFDWRTNIALTGGLAAKEVIVATMGTAYSLGDTEDSSENSLAERLASEPGWNPLSAFTLMLFVMIYSPCAVTVVAISREAGWKWAVFSMVYSTALAYFVCLAVFKIGSVFGLGV